MLRQTLLATTFLAAFTTFTMVPATSAEAWGRWGVRRPYVSYYAPAPPAAYYYNGYTPYRAYYGGPRYYRPYYGGYYGYYGGPQYYYGPRSGVSVSFGF